MEKKILKRLSNYLIYELEKDDFGYLCISTVMGDWQLSYREDTPMYASIRMLMDNDAAIGNFCLMVFLMSYSLHKSEVYSSFVAAVVKELDSVGASNITKEKDEEILSETMDMEDLKENIKDYGEDEV